MRFFHAVKKGVHRVFVDHPLFLAKVWGKTGAKLYGARSGADFADNHKRFSLFCRAAIEAARALPFGPGEDALFVANDWHSALVPVLLKVRAFVCLFVCVRVCAVAAFERGVVIKRRALTTSLNF